MKNYTDEQREEAATLCALAALSDSVPVESYFHIANEIDASPDALELATEAWCAVAAHTNETVGDRGWSDRTVHGEAESLIRTGYSGGPIEYTIDIGSDGRCLEYPSEKLFAFGEHEAPTVTDDHGIMQAMAEIPSDASMFDDAEAGYSPELHDEE